jgi:hypothetical protein
VTGGLATSRKTLGTAGLLAGLAAVIVLVALFTPEAASDGSGARSSSSASPGGARIVFELAQRMGWRASRRVVPLDSTVVGSPVTHVVLAPQQGLGAHEVHRLLDNVRRGGGLLFTLDGADEIADSLGIAEGRAGRFLSSYRDASCPTRRSVRERSLATLPPEVRQIVWKRPAPGPLTPIASTQSLMDRSLQVGVGFPMGKGRVAVLSTSELFGNDVVRQCSWGADLAVARALEFVRPPTEERPEIVFDEYHHGLGEHSGSVKAVGGYFAGTSSGHFLAQALVAGLLLVLAAAPRPIVPKDPERIARRSPLEHADALGHAYADVGATRTATSRLVSGLRRRTIRVTSTHAGADEQVFLDGLASRFPETAASVDILRRALRETLPARELVGVGEAIRQIEQHITTSPPPRS